MAMGAGLVALPPDIDLQGLEFASHQRTGMLVELGLEEIHRFPETMGGLSSRTIPDYHWNRNSKEFPAKMTKFLQPQTSDWPTQNRLSSGSKTPCSDSNPATGHLPQNLFGQSIEQALGQMARPR